jgi:nucleotide-binding universal stress UspA family protein
MAITNIVVGIDGSETSYRAFAMAVGLAAREHGCVHACFVDHVPAIAAVGGLALAPVPAPVDPEGDGQLARFVAAELGRARVDGDFTWQSGEIAIGLERLATTCVADVIVVGRSAHPHLHLGGVPRQLLSRGRWPVLVVP